MAAVAQDIRDAVAGVRTAILGVFTIGFVLGILFLFAEKVPFLNETLGNILRSNQGFFDIVILMLLVVAVIVGAGVGLKVLQRSFGE